MYGFLVPGGKGHVTGQNGVEEVERKVDVRGSDRDPWLGVSALAVDPEGPDVVLGPTSLPARSSWFDVWTERPSVLHRGVLDG